MTSCFDSRPVVLRRRRFDPGIAHAWIRFDNNWLATMCAKANEAFAPNEYEFLPAGSHVTCMTCLVNNK